MLTIEEEIQIESSPEGRVTVRTIGIKGPRCLECAEMVARIVGQEESRELTSEYYEGHTQTHDQVDIKQRR